MGSVLTLPDPLDQTIPTTTGVTHLETSRSILQWNIQNVDRILPNEAEMGLQGQDSYFSEFKALRSPEFTTTFGQSGIKKSEQKWFVSLDLKVFQPGNNGTALVDGKRYIALCLHLQPQPRSEERSHTQIKPLRLHGTFSMLGRNEKEYQEGSGETSFKTMEETQETGWGFKQFIMLSELWKYKDSFILNNVLRIKVDLTVCGSPITEKMGVGLQESLSFASNKFVDDMKHLLTSGTDTDLTIQCSGKNFFVHTPILKGRCLVFNRMLEADMLESKEKVIKIDDVDPVILEAFLEFVYTAQVELQEASVEKLMGLVQVADKYGVEELKSICFKYIAENISLETAGEIAVLAFQHNAEEDIRFKIVTFCQSNWAALAKFSTFRGCVKDNPLAFLHVIRMTSQIEMKPCGCD